MQVGVVGAGSWGTTIAHLCSQKADVIIYCRDDKVATAINTLRENPRYLSGYPLGPRSRANSIVDKVSTEYSYPDYPLNPRLRATYDLARVVEGVDLLVMGVPVAGFRNTLRKVRHHLSPEVPVVSLAKGLEPISAMRMTEVAKEELGQNPAGVLTGPNLAKEILSGKPAAAVVAFEDIALATGLQSVFSTSAFRVYAADDVVGCELAGSLKNVIALAAGMADGYGWGNNARAAVITRGLAEITRLGVAMGAQPETFAGPAGLGDLIATCMSPQSRNRGAGEQLAKGRTLEEIRQSTNQVAEGVTCVPAALQLAAEHGVSMPICEEVNAFLRGERVAKTRLATMSVWEEEVNAFLLGERDAETSYRRLLQRDFLPEAYPSDFG